MGRHTVKMWNGKLNQLEIMGLNEDGELYVKEIRKTGETSPDFREFSCSGYNWKRAIELGEKMGWMPTGTVLKGTIGNPNPKTGDYQPSSWDNEDIKVFLAEDAVSFANALAKAVELMKEFRLAEYGGKGGGYINPSIDFNQLKQINQNLTIDFLTDFIVFLRKGKFCFVWDDILD